MSFSVILNISVKLSIKSITDLFPTNTPFGTPVEPDVKFAYSGSKSRTFYRITSNLI